MRYLSLVVLFATACATPGAVTRSSPSAGRASTKAVNATVRGDYAAALAAADRGLAAHPGDAWLLYDRGVALSGLGRVDEAVATLRDAEARFDTPHDRSLAAYRRALTLEFAGRCAEAARDFSEYATLVRSTQPVLADEALAHVNYCVTPSEQQLAQRREEDRVRATIFTPQQQAADRASTAAVKALTRGDYEAALHAADEGLIAAPDHPWLLYNRGIALADLGRTDEALASLRQAELRFAPADVHDRSVATYGRAVALERAGRCQEERAELDHYASLVGRTGPALAQNAAAHLRFCRLATRHPTM
jgi:tetratricopeptide (TPR) repeat protein